ncbi:hypothetical protein ACFLZP_00250 [Patescibacteria group bacterium]
MRPQIALADVNIKDHLQPPFESFGSILTVLLPNVYIIASVILFLFLLVGGFGVIINAGKGEKDGVAQSGKVVSAAVIGFIIIIGSYWLIQIISVVTGLNILGSGL